MTRVFQHLTNAYNGATEIAGTGLRVYTVLGMYEMGDSAEYIAQEAGVPIAAVFEALAYAYEHPDEMDAIRRADEAAHQEWLSGQPEHLRRMAERTRRSDAQKYQKAVRQTREARLGTMVS